MSVKRGSRNTLQAQMTMDSALTGGMTDPRFQMYNKEMIKSHLEKRRVRRAQSNIKPRKRFSTISAFHKNDVQVVHRHLQEEGITPTNNSKCRYIDSYPARILSVKPHLVTCDFCVRLEAVQRHRRLVSQRQPGGIKQKDSLIPYKGLQLGTCLLNSSSALPRTSLT